MEVRIEGDGEEESDPNWEKFPMGGQKGKKKKTSGNPTKQGGKSFEKGKVHKKEGTQLCDGNQSTKEGTRKYRGGVKGHK